MKPIRSVALGLVIALALAGCAARETSVQSAPPAGPQVSLDTLKGVTQRLSADDFEGRAPSTAVEPKVLDYIVSTFQKAGLKPGYKGGWLQEVPTVEITGDHYSPLTVTGGKAPLSFAFGSD